MLAGMDSREASSTNAPCLVQTDTAPSDVTRLPRRILGDVSPNPKVAPPRVGVFGGKPIASSPLKRSHTAVMEGGKSLTCIKKRKLLANGFLEENGQTEETEQTHSLHNVSRPILEATQLEGPALESAPPEIQQPSPTEPNTPSADVEDMPNSSGEVKSFSSLINYGLSSQTSNLASRPVSNAETLRLRLKVAMFKVRTNQVDVPFGELHVGGPQPPQPPPGLSLRQEVIDETVARLRHEAQEAQPRHDHVPALRPAPVLLPTAYSSRMIHDRCYPSSPPASTSPDRLPFIPPLSTPHQSTRRVSPSRSSVNGRRDMEQELTSSVVKGKVAEGLLGLRNAA